MTKLNSKILVFATIFVFLSKHPAMWINTESIVRDLFNLAPYGKMWIRRQKNRQEPQKTAKIKYVLQFFYPASYSICWFSAFKVNLSEFWLSNLFSRQYKQTCIRVIITNRYYGRFLGYGSNADIYHDTCGSTSMKKINFAICKTVKFATFI